MTDDIGHDWHLIDVNRDMQCRQLSNDKFQLANKTHYVTVDKNTFDKWLDRKITTDELMENAAKIEKDFIWEKENERTES